MKIENNFLIRLLTGVPIGSKTNTMRNQTSTEINTAYVKPPKPPPTHQMKATPQQQGLQNVNSNNLLSLGKGMAQPDVPFMKSVMPVTSLFSSIKSGVQTSVTAAVKAGKQQHYINEMQNDIILNSKRQKIMIEQEI